MFDRNNRIVIDSNIDYIDLRAIHSDCISVIFYFVFIFQAVTENAKRKEQEAKAEQRKEKQREAEERQKKGLGKYKLLKIDIFQYQLKVQRINVILFSNFINESVDKYSKLFVISGHLKYEFKKKALSNRFY